MPRPQQASLRDLVQQKLRARRRVGWECQVPPELREQLEAEADAFESGEYGQSVCAFCKAIAEAMAEFGIVVGRQGVNAWLSRRRQQKP